MTVHLLNRNDFESVEMLLTSLHQPFHDPFIVHGLSQDDCSFLQLKLNDQSNLVIVREDTDIEPEKIYLISKESEFSFNGTNISLSTKKNSQLKSELVLAAKAVTQEVMKEKEPTRAYEESETLLHGKQDLINNVNGIVFEVDIKTFSFTFVSEQVEKILGYTPEEWLSKPNSFWQSMLHHEDKKWVIGYCEKKLRKLKNYSFEYRLIHKDGRVVWIKDYTSMIVKNGQVIKVLGLMVDITKQKLLQVELNKVNQELNLAIKMGKIGICEKEPNGNRLRHNDELLNIFETSKDTLASLDAFLSFVVSEDLEMVRSQFSLLKEGQRIYEFRFRIKIGSKIKHISASGLSTFYEDDKANGVFLVCRDITDAIEYQIKLENSLVEKDNLFRELHHRIKNNLQMVLSLLHLKEHKGDSKLQAFIRDTCSKIQSIATIHEQLLLIRGVGELDIQLYLKALIDNIKKTYDSDGRIITEVDIESAKFNIDRALSIGLIINEVISNSFKHAFPHSDSGKISVSLQKKEREFELIVSDNGIGIEQKELSTNDPSYGMELIKAFCNQIEGQFELSSMEGTSFMVRFPYQLN